MDMLKKAVIETPQFEKVAGFELSTDVSDWNEEILNKFFEEVNYLPANIGTDIVMTNVDENTGYAKGSVVAWYQDKKINFPIIVKDYQLSPFDVFIVEKEKGKFKYFNATEKSVKENLMAQSLGVVENIYDGIINENIKSPGDIAPKQSVDIDEDLNNNIQAQTGSFYKMSSYKHWTKTAGKKDLEKFAEELEVSPGMQYSFYDNTGDLAKKVVELAHDDERSIGNDHDQGILDINDVIEAKQTSVALDSELFDVDSLKPINPPSVCELRMYSYPSMQDFMETGDSAVSRYEASKIGKPVTGIVLDYKDSYAIDQSCQPVAMAGSMTEDQEKLNLREKRPQIFLSADGNYYSIQDDYQKTGVCFYGANVIETDGIIEKVVNRIIDKTHDDFTNFSKYNRNSKSDKLLAPNLPYDKDIDNSRNCNKSDEDGYSGRLVGGSYGRDDLLCIYGAGNIYEALCFSGKFRKSIVNGAKCFISPKCAVIPARVASIQRVDSVMDDPVYKMLIGKCEKIYLVPETSQFINLSLMKRLNDSDFMRPDKSIQKVYEERAINKVAMDLGKEGYIISGKPVENLYKIAGIKSGTELSTTLASTVLRTIGMTKKASDEAMKVVLNRASIEKVGHVDIYGVRDDYVKPNAFNGIEKKARLKEIFKGLSQQLKTNLTKEASMIDDPESVDVMLSLNFINEDNIMSYIENIAIIRKVLSNLASMIIASRMGLSTLDEGALKKSVEGLQDVVDGLENVKMAIGK